MATSLLVAQSSKLLDQPKKKAGRKTCFFLGSLCSSNETVRRRRSRRPEHTQCARKCPWGIFALHRRIVALCRSASLASCAPCLGRFRCIQNDTQSFWTCYPAGGAKKKDRFRTVFFLSNPKDWHVISPQVSM